MEQIRGELARLNPDVLIGTEIRDWQAFANAVVSRSVSKQEHAEELVPGWPGMKNRRSSEPPNHAGRSRSVDQGQGEDSHPEHRRDLYHAIHQRVRFSRTHALGFFQRDLGLRHRRLTKRKQVATKGVDHDEHEQRHQKR